MMQTSAVGRKKDFQYHQGFWLFRLLILMFDKCQEI